MEMAVKNDFKTLYYRTANCLTSDIIADANPVSRALGVDLTAGFGTVFTAMGSRFDIRFVAKEGFLATENYESDTRSVDKVSVAEAMRYVRSQTIAENALPEAYKPFVETVRAGGSVYKQYRPVQEGPKDAAILFLMSPAAADPAAAAQQFAGLAGRLGRSALCTNQFGDCGYLRLQLGLTDEQQADAQALAAEIGRHELTVTDDQFVLDAVLIQLPELADKVLFIDEFLAKNKEALGLAAKGRVMLHESGTVQRLYPTRRVDTAKLLEGAQVVLPARSGYDTTDSGLAGGLGLAEPQAMLAVAARRMEELNRPACDAVVTPCACEAMGLNCAEKGHVSTLLEFVCAQ